MGGKQTSGLLGRVSSSFRGFSKFARGGGGVHMLRCIPRARFGVPAHPAACHRFRASPFYARLARNKSTFPTASNQIRIPQRTSDLAFTTSTGFQKSIMIPRKTEWFCNLADVKSADPGKGSRLEDAHVSMRSCRTLTATRNFSLNCNGRT